MNNILITSVGRRVELVKLFKDAAKKFNNSSSVVAADCSPLAPAIYVADKHYIVPKLFSPDYISKLIDICIKEQISIIVPTIDTELLLLSQNKQKIEEATDSKVLVSNYEVVKICRNKLLTGKYLSSNGFLTPKTYSFEDINENTIFPLFIKPIDGSSSINAHKVDSLEELNFYVKTIENFLIQEFIYGDEYTIDVFLDFESNIITIVPRLRIATRGGEILQGKICKDRSIIDDVKRLMQILKPIGHITVQVIKKDEKIYYIEINPRFGGGAPMSILAGANSCLNLFKLLNNENPEYNENYIDGMIFLRFDNCIALNNNMEVQNV